MKKGLGAYVPSQRLRDLDFLLGESSGPGVLTPPDRSPIEFTGHLKVEREECDRFLKMDFFGRVPILGSESIHTLITYSEKDECYRMWSFAASQEEPMHLRGRFDGLTLVFLSDPSEMIWGIQRMRCAFTPLDEGVVDYRADLWTTDGYRPYFRATYTEASMRLR